MHVGIFLGSQQVFLLTSFLVCCFFHEFFAPREIPTLSFFTTLLLLVVASVLSTGYFCLALDSFIICFISDSNMFCFFLLFFCSSCKQLWSLYEMDGEINVRVFVQLMNFVSPSKTATAQRQKMKVRRRRLDEFTYSFPSLGLVPRLLSQNR